MPAKTVAAFTALSEKFLAHHEGGNTISVYPLSDGAFKLTCAQNAPLPAGMELYSQPHKVLLEMAQADCAERMDAIYRTAREAIGWDRAEWYCRVPNDDPPDELMIAAGLPIDPDA